MSSSSAVEHLLDTVRVRHLKRRNPARVATRVVVITAGTASRALLQGVICPKVGDCIDLHVGSRDLDGWHLQLRHENVAEPLEELQLRVPTPRTPRRDVITKIVGKPIGNVHKNICYSQTRRKGDTSGEPGKDPGSEVNFGAKVIKINANIIKIRAKTINIEAKTIKIV